MCVSNKTSPTEKANGLNLKTKGASYSLLMFEMVLGFSCHPETILNYEKTLAEANKTEVQKQNKGSHKSGIIHLNHIKTLYLFSFKLLFAGK